MKKAIIAAAMIASGIAGQAQAAMTCAVPTARAQVVKAATACAGQDAAAELDALFTEDRARDADAWQDYQERRAELGMDAAAPRPECFDAALLAALAKLTVACAKAPAATSDN